MCICVYIYIEREIYTHISLDIYIYIYIYEELTRLTETRLDQTTSNYIIAYIVSLRLTPVAPVGLRLEPGNSLQGGAVGGGCSGWG